MDAGDYVTVTNALDVHLSGKKSTDKVYVSHSGFMGGLKEVPIGRMRERRPEEVSFPVWAFGRLRVRAWSMCRLGGCVMEDGFPLADSQEA